MSDVVFRVRGEAERAVTAERGTAHLTVGAQGPEPGAVRSRVEADTAAVVADARRWHDPDAGPVRRLVVDQVRTRVERPGHEGRRRPAVHHASVTVSVEFDDVARLGSWLSELGGIAGGAQVDRIEWGLPDDRRRELERAVRQEALRQARERAQDYSDALELGPVVPRSVADVGLLGGHAPGARAFARAAAAPEAAGDDGLGALLEPDDVTVQASVEAEFVVTPHYS